MLRALAEMDEMCILILFTSKGCLIHGIQAFTRQRE